MFFQSTAEGYVCPVLDTRKKQPEFITQLQKLISREMLFLQMSIAAILVLIVVVFGAGLWVGKIADSIDQSTLVVEQERNELMDKNIALRVERTYLFSPQYINKVAVEKLGMHTADKKQIRYLN